MTDAESELILFSREALQGSVQKERQTNPRLPLQPHVECVIERRPREGNSGHGAQIQLLSVIRGMAAGQSKDMLHGHALRRGHMNSV